MPAEPPTPRDRRPRPQRRHPVLPGSVVLLATRTPLPDLRRRNEPHGQGVHAVARVGLREALSKKHVAKVAAATGALDLRAEAIGVPQVGDGAGDLVIKGWPAAVGVELVLGAVQLGVAPPAKVDAILVEVVVLA